MEVVEFDHGLVLAAPAPGYVRSKGLHASDLYGSLYRELEPGKYDKRNPDGSKIPIDDTKMEIGTSFETILEPALAARLLGERPEEFTAPHDKSCKTPRKKIGGGKVCQCGGGVQFSPDYLFNIDGRLVLGEFKCTYYSTKGAPDSEKFAMWHCQIMLYLYWLSLTQCRLYVMFLCGDYRPPRPMLKAYQLTYQARELQENYQDIIRHGIKKGLL